MLAILLDQNSCATLSFRPTASTAWNTSISLFWYKMLPTRPHAWVGLVVKIFGCFRLLSRSGPGSGPKSTETSMGSSAMGAIQAACLLWDGITCSEKWRVRIRTIFIASLYWCLQPLAIGKIRRPHRRFIPRGRGSHCYNPWNYASVSSWNRWRVCNRNGCVCPYKFNTCFGHFTQMIAFYFQ